MPSEASEASRLRWVAGNGGHPLVGTATQIADRLEHLAEIGIDGSLLGWPLREEGMARFEADVLPLLFERGPRAPSPDRSPDRSDP